VVGGGEGDAILHTKDDHSEELVDSGKEGLYSGWLVVDQGNMEGFPAPHSLVKLRVNLSVEERSGEDLNHLRDLLGQKIIVSLLLNER